MSKTVTEIGMIVVGAAATAVGFAVPGAQWLAGIGVSTMLTGFGMALRPVTKPVGSANTITFGDGTSPRRVIYGQFQTAGVLTDASFPPSQNLSTTNQYLHLIYTLAGHEISSFDGIVIDGTIYNFGTDLIYGGGVGDDLWHLFTGSNVNYNDIYWQHVFFEFDFGRPLNDNQPFPALAAADSSWTSDCLQQGCAKVHLILRADANWPVIFPSGQIPNIQFLVTGKKIVDPRIITAWLPSTGYVQYDYIIDNRGEIWVQTNASGTSGTVRPGFEGTSGVVGNVLADNTCSWTSATFQIQSSQGVDAEPQGHLVKGRLVNDVWAPGSSWATGVVIEAPLGYLQLSTVMGVAGATEPAFGLTVGATVTDGTQQWVCLGRSWHAINPSNPALIAADYLQDTDYGLATAPASIDFSSVMAAANVCEELVPIIVNADGTVVYENTYAADGMFDFSSNRGDVLSSICAAMAGWCIPPGDLWHVFAGSFQSPTVSLGDGDMRGPIKGDFRLSRRDVCNSVKGKFTPAYLPANPAAVVSMTQLPGLWREQSFPAYQANGFAGKPNYLNSEDGGQIVWLDLRLDFTTSLWMAQRLAKIALMRTRFQQALTLACKTTALQLEAGDTFSFTHLRWNIASQTFEVQQASITVEAVGGRSEAGNDAPALGVDIQARQTDPSVYEFQGPTSATNCG
jgi:hypothetical protein